MKRIPPRAGHQAKLSSKSALTGALQDSSHTVEASRGLSMSTGANTSGIKTWVSPFEKENDEKVREGLYKSVCMRVTCRV